MSSSIKNVILVGAKGNLGSIVLQHLISANFNVSILSRESSSDLSTPKIKVFQTDYSEDSLTQAFKGQDAVVSTVGVIGKMTQTKLIDAAIANGVKRFIPSDYAYKTYDMSDLERIVPLIHQRLMPNKVILDYLEEKAAQNPDFTWTALGGGPLFDWTLKVGFLGTSLSNHTSTIIDSGNEPYNSVTIPQLARAIVSTLSHPSETANKYLTVTSFLTTQNQILTAAEKVTGSKFEVTRVSAEEWYKQGVEQFSKQDLGGLRKLWAYFFWRDGEGKVQDLENDNKLLGLPVEDMEEVMSVVAGL